MLLLVTESSGSERRHTCPGRVNYETTPCRGCWSLRIPASVISRYAICSTFPLTWTSQNQKGTRLACIKHVKECMIKTENSSQCGFRSLRQHLSGISLFSRFDRLTLMRLRHILPFSPRRVV